MTENGGANNVGVTFSLPITGGTPNDLFSFNISDLHTGGIPEGSLTLDGSTLYGMTYSGGAHGYGTIFAEPTSGGADHLGLARWRLGSW